MARRKSICSWTATFLVLVTALGLVECGWKDWIGGGHHGGGWDSGWESKGVTFGLKSKGMTAIIPFPLPIPIFSKEKKKEDDGGGDTKGWEPPSGGNDWWK